jgi:hypothetical protein
MNSRVILKNRCADLRMGALSLFCLLLFPCFAGATDGWDRYAAIVARVPFGQEPPPPDTPVARQPDGAFARQYRLCMLYEDAQGRLKAGLVSKTNNKNYFLQVGESEDDLQLLDVRIEEGIAVLEKSGETAEILLEGLNLPPAAGAPAQAVARTAPRNTEIRQVRSAGAPDAPEHIRTALRGATSAPKRARLTLTKKTAEPVGTDGSADKTGESNELFRRRPAIPSGAVAAKQKTEETLVARKSRSPGGYLIQSVPQHLEKKMLAKGL